MYNNREAGFTLIEISLVLLISGIILSASAYFLKIYTTNLKHETTLENIEISQAALSEYIAVEGVYPCPADPTLAPSDANYGISQCRSTADLTNNPDDCIGVPGNIVCTSDFSRDSDNNGSADLIMIGAFPFRTIFERDLTTPYNEFNKIDGFGSLLSYAVTEEMTNNSRYNFLNPVNLNYGSIRIIDENAISLTVPDDSAHYVLFSHGDNKKGAYSREGVQAEDCTVPSVVAGAPPVVPPPGPSANNIQVDVENCDNNDAIFVKGIRSSANTSSYNDDILFYEVSGILPLWKKSFNSTSTNNIIYNTNTGPVGIGTDNPTYQLHVMGDLSAESALISDRYCDGDDLGDSDSDPTNGDNNTCLLPSAIAGTGSSCGAPNTAAYAIQDNEVVCRTVDWVTPNKSCSPISVAGTPTASFLNGFSNLGNIYCCTSDGECEEQ